MNSSTTVRERRRFLVLSGGALLVAGVEKVRRALWLPTAPPPPRETEARYYRRIGRKERQ